MIVLDAVERIDVEVHGFRVITDEGPVRYSVEIVMPRDDILSVDLLCPPPQHDHAVLLGGVATIAIMATELLQLVVQVSHGV